MMRILSATLVLALGATALAQEPAFEALGQAPVVAGDRVRARDRALDEALRQAVEQAAGTVLTPDELVGRASDLKLRIYPRARSYVTNYRILDEGEIQPGTFQVHLSAQVATARLARDLAGSAPSTSTLPRLSQKLRAVVCVQASDPLVADAGSKVVKDVLAARNVESVPAPDGCTPDAAAQAARSSAAQAAVVGTVGALPAGDIRGTEDVAAHARAKLELVEPDGRVSAAGEAERDAYAPILPRAGVEAAREAMSEAARTVQPALAQRWAAAAPTSGGVTVHLSGVQRYADYQAVTRALASLPGVAAVEPRRFARNQVDVLVKTVSGAGQLVTGLQRLPPQGVQVKVRAVNEGTLQIDVTGPAENVVPERG